MPSDEIVHVRMEGVRKTVTLMIRYLVAIVTVLGLMLIRPLVVAAQPLADGTYYYKGTIGGNLAIGMRLDAKAGAVSGIYVYDKVGSPLILIGSIDAAGSIVANEYDESANHTGIIRVAAVNYDKLEGTWSRPDGSDKLSFSAVRAQEWSGKWALTDHYNADGLLEINNVTESEFTFRLDVANLYRAHFGRIRGTAKIGSGEAVWDDGKGARMVFRLEQDKVTIATENCEMYAGINVGFNGPYLREPQMSLVRRGVFKDAAQVLNFIRLVGDDYKLFLNSFDLISKLKDLDGYGAMVNGGLFHQYWDYKNDQVVSVVMCTPDGGIWAAVIDKSANNIRYYTNRPEGQVLPKTIAGWRDGLSTKYDVVFVNQ